MKVFEFVILFLFLGFISPVFSAQPYVDQKGDVNNDGTINVLDILSVVNHILGIVILDEQGIWRADCNGSEGNCDGDGVINIMDALKIVNILLGNDVCGNARPTASFTVDPTSGTTETTFSVDASSSSDIEDSTSSLEVRWDWENDGTYDTDWSATQTNSHQYSTIGDKVIKLEVRDSGGLLDTETHPVMVIPDSNTVTDIDGNVYHTITIGTQTWMAENLKTTRYNDGSAIPNVTDNGVWYNLTTPAYCWYDNDISHKADCGALYNWYAVNTRRLAPAGWHVPTREEWATLIDYLGGADIAGGKLKETGTAHWLSPNTGATNETGFTARGVGIRDITFMMMLETTYIWSSTSEAGGSTGAYQVHLYWNYPWANLYPMEKYSGFAVRCIKD